MTHRSPVIVVCAALCTALLAACSSDPTTTPPTDPPPTANTLVIPTADPVTPVIDQAAIDALTTRTAAEADAALAANMGTPGVVGAQAATPPPPTGTDGQPAALVVNGTIIDRTTYERAQSRFQMQVGGGDDAQLRALVVNMLVEQALIDQAAAGQGIAVTDEVLNAELENARALAGGDEGWQLWLTQNGYSEDEFRATLRDALLTGLIRDAVTQDLNGDWLHANARHILVTTAAEADALIGELSSGADFAALSALHSLDQTTRTAGGDLGWFMPGELLEAALDQAAFQRPIGEIGPAIPSSLGYHVLEVLGREQRPVDADRRAVLAQSRFEDWLNNLIAAASIVVYI